MLSEIVFYILLKWVLFFFTVVVKQRLHATHNLMELLSANHAGIPPTLRDDRLTEEVTRKRFLSCTFTLKSYFVPKTYLFVCLFVHSCSCRRSSCGSTT